MSGKRKKKRQHAREEAPPTTPALTPARLVLIRRKLLAVFSAENLAPADALHVMIQLAATFATTQGVGRLGFLGTCSRLFGGEKKRMLAAKVDALEKPQVDRPY